MGELGRRRLGGKRTVQKWTVSPCSIAGLISSLVIYGADGFTMITLGEPESENRLNAEQGGPAWPECMPQLNTAKTESV